MDTPAERQLTEIERGRRIATGLDRIRSEWQPFLGLVIGAPNRLVLLSWVKDRYGVDDEVAEIALDQRLAVLVPVLDE